MQKYLTTVLLVLLLPLALADPLVSIDARRSVSNSIYEFEFAAETASPLDDLCQLSLEGMTAAQETFTMGEADAVGDTYEFTWAAEGLRDGEYTLSVTCHDATGSATQVHEFSVRDQKPPSFEEGTPRIASTETTSASIEVQTSEPALFTLYMSVNSQESTLTKELGTEEATSSTFLRPEGLASDTRYFFQVDTCDINGQCKRSGTYTFFTKAQTQEMTVEKATSYLASDVIASVEHGWGFLEVGETISLEMDEEDLAMQRFEARLGQNATGVKVQVKSLEKLPSNVPSAPLEHVFQYWSISVSNLEQARADVYFRAPAKWGRQHKVNVSDMQLYYFEDDTWQPVRLFLEEESLHFSTYHAPIPGFGVFALGGAEMEIVEEENVEEVMAAVEPEEEEQAPLITGQAIAPPDVALDEDHSSAGWGVIALMGVVVAAVILAGGFYFLHDVVKLRRGFDSGDEQAGMTQYEEYMERLESFVAEASAKGYTREVIRDKLLRAGWKQEIVDPMLNRYID
jgi:PGF-pre-PGF domain-containing protein